MVVNMMLTGPELPEEGEEGRYFYDLTDRQLYVWLGGWVPVMLDTPVAAPIYEIREWP